MTKDLMQAQQGIFLGLIRAVVDHLEPGALEFEIHHLAASKGPHFKPLRPRGHFQIRRLPFNADTLPKGVILAIGSLNELCYRAL